jgi:hypothetical protein
VRRERVRCDELTRGILAPWLIRLVFTGESIGVSRRGNGVHFRPTTLTGFSLTSPNEHWRYIIRPGRSLRLLLLLDQARYTAYRNYSP